MKGARRVSLLLGLCATFACGGGDSPLGGAGSVASPATPPPPPEPEAPATPSGLTVSATTENSITWIWNAVEGATAYAVQISMDEVFGDDDPIAMALAPTYTVSDLPASSSVYLRVASVRTSLEESLRSAWSTRVTGTTAAPAPLPGPPPSPDRPFSGTEVLPGVSLLVSPVERLRGRDWVRTTVELRVSIDADAGVFEWFTPYARANDHSATFWANIAEWRVELFESGATLHTLDIEWPADKEVGLRFRSDTSTGGEQPTVRCTASACSVTR